MGKQKIEIGFPIKLFIMDEIFGSSYFMDLWSESLLHVWYTNLHRVEILGSSPA